MNRRRVFLDTAYAIALSSTSDRHHEQALLLSEELEADSARLVTTHAIVIEIGDALAKLRYRQASVDLLGALEADPNMEIVPMTEGLYRTAAQLYRSRADKEWGMTDGISFTVMKQRAIRSALTTDEHFVQAGFDALLR